MAFGKGRREFEIQIICLKYTIFAFNFLFWLMGAIIFSLSVWIRFDDDFQKWVYAIDMEHYWVGIYILMIVALGIMGVSFMGCCGVIMEHTFLIYVYIGVLLVCFVLELGGAAYTLNNGLYQSKIYPWLMVNLQAMVGRYMWDEDARRAMDMIQDWVHCCGGDGSGDYIAINVEVPHSCYDPVQGNEWGDSCSEAISYLLETKSGLIAGMTLFLAFFQILVVMFSCCLIRSLKAEAKRL